jgi:3-oxoacyl-[acyl-carrier-protein] synthase II
MSEVVITGIGATTPLGGTAAATWQGLLDGRSGIGALDQAWTTRIEPAVGIAGQVAVEPGDVLSHAEMKRLARCEQLALVAARAAWADASLDEDAVSPQRRGVVVGTGIGGVSTMAEQHDAVRDNGVKGVSPHVIPMIMPNGPAAHVGLALRARAGVHAPMSACAAGAEALAWAWRMLCAGDADVVVAGGTDACITPVILAGFVRARSMSRNTADPTKASRPFDVDRDGFVLGEGAGMLVLERAEFAAARGARIYGRLAGVGMSNDAYHMTAPDPDATGQVAAITAALNTAGLTPRDIGHVNAHATATPLGDLAEAGAIRAVLGDAPVVTACKGALGHLLGASGAVEAIATVLALREQTVPPTVNHDNPDPAIGLDVVTGAPRPIPATAALSNSFGFGGHNVCLAFTPA